MNLKEDDRHQDLTNGNEEDDYFSEDILRQLCKTLRTIIPKNEAEIDQHTLIHLQSLHRGLLRTANSTRLSFAHGAAALNALCGFIEQCDVSSIAEIRELSFSSAAWTKAFNLFLERSERHKTKPVRRLLLALTQVLKNHKQANVKLLLLGHAVSRATRTICGQPDTASVKPAIQSLEHFINVGLITAREVTSYAIKVSYSSQAVSEAGRAQSTSLQRDEAAKDFAMSVLEWVQFPDCAPAAGRFLCTFFKSLNADSRDQAVSDETVPLWIYPVKQAINSHLERLEVFEHHVLPGLLTLSPADTRAFLKTLPLEDLKPGTVGPDAAANIHLCLVIAKVAAPLGLLSGSAGDLATPMKGAATSRDQNGTEEPESFLIDPEALACNYLRHVSASVRLSALSLLVSSSITSKPFTRSVLETLRVCLPYFHVEVSAKSRNEYIALMKKLCVRLERAITSLLRAEHTSLNFGFEESSTCQPDPVTTNTAAWKPREQLLRSHIEFGKRYVLFLIHELRPTASYQSHITALKILHSLFEGESDRRATLSRGNYERLNALDKTLPQTLCHRALYDLLLDPFDDVRQWAARVLELCIESDLAALGSPLVGTLTKKPERVDHKGEITADGSVIDTELCIAEKKAEQTGRADHADGVGRLYELLYSANQVVVEPTERHHSSLAIVDLLIFKTEKEVVIATDDLLHAVGNASLHGHLIALRHIVSHPEYFVRLGKSTKNALDQWRTFTERIHLICGDVWEVVRHTLCFDAPEGHEIDEEADDVDIGTKDVLSFCWRALKESSALLHAIIANRGYGPPSSEGDGLSYEDYCRIGALSFSQLAQLRHRGAFSTVSQTFSACCTACAGSSNLNVSGLLQSWYHDALACMELNATALTRRSAGIPAMITGVLAACAGHGFFDDVVLDLQAIADGPITYVELGDARLPQVHALNCLKDIFTDARFGPSTEVHVADTISIAASCLDNSVWAIRNCGSMLFKALVRRLNGGTDTASIKIKSSYRRSSHLVYERYPNLRSLLFKLLCDELRLTTGSINIAHHDSHSVTPAHKVFPAMELLEILGLPNERGEIILEAIWQYMESFDWAIREKAAKALSHLLDTKDIISDARKLLSPVWPTQNALHGRLLCLQHLVSRDDIPLICCERLVPLINDRYNSIAVQNSCPITVAAFLNVLADISIVLVQNRSQVMQSIFNQMKLLSRTPLTHPRDPEESSATVLKSRALERCLSLVLYLESLTKPLHQLSAEDVDTMMTLDEANKYMSDETFLAVLRIVSPDHLRHQLNVTRAARIPLADVAPSVYNSYFALAVSGYDLALSYGGTQDEELNQRISTWVHTLPVSGSEDSELLSRAATAYSLRGFFDGMQDCKKYRRSEPALLGPYIVLYDILVDDDEEIREQGSRTVSLLLSGHTDTSLSLSPAAAKSRLLDFLEQEYRGSTIFSIEAVHKLTGLPSICSATSHKFGSDEDDNLRTIPLQLRPVAELLLEARAAPIAVFIEEKLNLYVDQVLEADGWANILVNMDAAVWKPTVVSELQSWTTNGLDYLLQFCERMSDLEALSLISISEVYTLFMRVILSAKVLVNGATQMDWEESRKNQNCRVLLERLLELGTQKQLHGLLLDRIRYILKNETHPTERI